MAGKMLLLCTLFFWALCQASCQLSPTYIQANSALVQAGQNENKSLTCLTSSSTDYDNRLQRAISMNISWVKTNDFTNVFGVDEEAGYVSLKNSSFGNVLELLNLQMADQYYYICGIFYSNGTFELFNSFNLFVTVTPQMHLIINGVLLEGIDAIVTRIGKNLTVACSAIGSNPSVYLTAINLNDQSYFATSESVPGFYDTTINREEYDESTGLYTNTIQFEMTIDESNQNMGSILCATTSKRDGIILTAYTKVDVQINNTISTSTTVTTTTSRNGSASRGFCQPWIAVLLLVTYFTAISIQ